MGERSVKLPDIGEGIAEAELVEWHVKLGDLVREDDLLATVMTDKASVEIPSPLAGEISWIGAQIGEAVAIGSTLVKLKVAGDDAAEPKDEAPAKDAPAPPAATKAEAPDARPEPAARVHPAAIETPPSPTSAVRRAPGEKPLASPAIRLKAREAGIDLRQVHGTGPAGRITHEDIDGFLSRGPAPVHGRGLSPKTAITDVKVVGLRRRIAEKMALSKSRIPHITIIEEVNVSPLEDLRASLNRKPTPEHPKLTLLPFLMRAMAKALAEQPALNALYDDEAGIVHQHAGIHIGIATQTPSGLVVPVVKHVEARDLRDCSIELNRLAQRAREGTATREELTGSTITITSLGALGGLATTPVINHPEVAIVGVNKIAVRPLWDGTQFVPCKMMNLSSSFDHRVIDGWDAAVFVQRLKELLENPATIFVDP
ncbi:MULTISPECIES: dihydrolipoamide acetyltransferase family protein [Bradyrhizobium]|uniref:dihydrolipoamide acetyltransferase family protein n=1 Tax=Bradyrhizobium TaxID=374 RepID=UPI001BADBE16|nr:MULTISPECIES: dihydrolipoamide acetyltransferase family protein [Bradyrhizobium]MBR0706424.1 2-oxo acid dehydrogenase subunit E2 [Bradyrhizobium liaoningense]MDA9404380.1 branched-chain alpha-keto acid dehydrogenase subunit E2 [Bradyrhizobium sp. CCBAU 45389]